MKKAVWVVLILLLVTAVSLRMLRFYEARANEKEREKLEKVYINAIEGKTSLHSSEDRKIIGKIMIPSLNINYIILNVTTDKNLDISITKVAGPAVHRNGNLVLAGHNMKNGSFFGRLNHITPQDKIYLENRNGEKKEYSMVDKYIVNKNDLSPLDQSDHEESIITLITCTQDPNKRLIVVAKKDT
ncbi:LPXTG-site transpeptidase (sortase) family protein [Bacillus sp. SORGH_AS 510]|uniref:sortase n=1 Tax=Bacillus sp. SORGH_AS_0510 TaxID=3041771 RepID=UPI00278B1A99|nr:sortase [Bacillus sp. SORGH_AS_0510]MDQ1144222.1 LPXTG-site transpeptidase (sortase) family protein [Bacillus sp. SORGH_AS_0510]